MFDPVRICQILNEEDVAYVIVGGFASVVHGSSLPTQDIDVVPSRQPDNLDRLGRALRRMNAMIRTGGDLSVPTGRTTTSPCRTSNPYATSWVEHQNGGVPPFGHKTQLRLLKSSIPPDRLPSPPARAAPGKSNAASDFVDVAYYR